MIYGLLFPSQGDWPVYSIHVFSCTYITVVWVHTSPTQPCRHSCMSSTHLHAHSYWHTIETLFYDPVKECSIPLVGHHEWGWKHIFGTPQYMTRPQEISSIPSNRIIGGWPDNSRCSWIIYLTCTLMLEPLMSGFCTEWLKPLATKQLGHTTHKRSHF